jgi:hypothetical protein
LNLYKNSKNILNKLYKSNNKLDQYISKIKEKKNIPLEKYQKQLINAASRKISFDYMKLFRMVLII